MFGAVITAIILTAVIAFFGYTMVLMLLWLLPFVILIGLFFLILGIIRVYQKAKE